MSGSQYQYNPLEIAVRTVLAEAQATQHYPNTTVATASGEGIIAGVPVSFYGFAYSITAANTALDIRFVDATATAVLTPVVYEIKGLPVGTNAVTFPRPLRFDHAFGFSVTATGTATPQLQYFWSPRTA